MSGINSTGKILVQHARSSGFDVDIYPDRISAAIQLMRSEIRTAPWLELRNRISDIRKAFNEFIEDEINQLDEACSTDEEN